MSAGGAVVNEDLLTKGGSSPRASWSFFEEATTYKYQGKKVKTSLPKTATGHLETQNAWMFLRTMQL